MAKAIAAYMQSECVGLAAGAAKSGVYAGVKRMLDVGGGSGAMAIAIAAHQPETALHGDGSADHVRRRPRAISRRAGFEGAIDILAGRYVPPALARPGYDGIVFSNIFHDWSFESCAALARWPSRR